MVNKEINGKCASALYCIHVEAGQVKTVIE